MPIIKVLPHAELCPEGALIEAKTGESVLLVLLNNNIRIEHACEMQCACTTCHVYIRRGSDSVLPPSELEEDMLDKAWGLDFDSRLSCQVLVGEDDLIVELPKYTINLASEKH